jgi:thiol-disulfide isomerase/thioredoxin
MHRYFFLLLIVGFLFSCKTEEKPSIPASHKESVETEKQVLVVEDFSTIASILEKHNDTTYVINFWATSCPPCIKEMPHFEQLNTKYREDKLRVILVSLDMKQDMDSRVKPFLKKHTINSEVILLADQNYSAWTDKIDPSWYGALPATLIFKNEDRKFFFGAFESFEDLEPTVKGFLRSQH